MQAHRYNIEILVAGEDLHPKVAELVVDGVELVDDGAHHLLVFLYDECRVSGEL